MAKLFLTLPSFATDYSGVCSVLYNMGGMVVIHDPSGCLGNYTNSDEPRWYYEPKAVFSSLLKEKEAISGDDGILIDKIKDGIERIHPRFICVLGTPVPMLTGCDVTGIADIVEAETGIPCIGLETSGYDFYDTGIKKILLMLEERFMREGPVMKGVVNVLGMTPLDFFINGEDTVLRSFIQAAGYSANFCTGMSEGFDQIIHAPQAEKNIVVSAAALPLAKRMKEKYGIPYYAGLPCGKYEQKNMMAFLTGDKISRSKEKNGYKRALIIGEQIQANAIRRVLQKEFDFGICTVASFFTIESSLAEKQDIHLKDENHLSELIQNFRWDVITGDPLYRLLAGHITFVPLPHPAVSSKLYWKEYVSLIDGKFPQYIKTFLG